MHGQDYFYEIASSTFEIQHKNPTHTLGSVLLYNVESWKVLKMKII